LFVFSLKNPFHLSPLSPLSPNQPFLYYLVLIKVKKYKSKKQYGGECGGEMEIGGE
jgi:hypothetical protein